MRLAFLIFTVLFTPCIWAVDETAESPEPAAFPEPPDLPLPVESGEVLDPEEPEITIKRRGKKTIREYRVNGVLYMVQIVPDIGPSYYLMDTDGDGNMDVRQSDLERGIKIPQWVLFRW